MFCVVSIIKKKKQFVENLINSKFLNFQLSNDDSEEEDVTQIVLKQIEMNNETTLIGTMDFSSFAEVRNPGNLYPICDNVMNFTDIDKFNVTYHVDESHNVQHSHQAVHPFKNVHDTSQTGLEEKKGEEEEDTF